MGSRAPARHADRAHHPGRALALPRSDAVSQRRAAGRGHQVHYGLRPLARVRRRRDGLAYLPDTVRALASSKPTPPRPAPPAVTVPVPGGGGECRHRTPAFLERGIAMPEQRITEATSGVHNAVYRTFLAVLSTHGRCGCLTDAHVGRLFSAAQAKGESARHCAEAWANALTTLGV